ncbi:MAG: 30S ribosomal protein S8 [Gemmatimonadetes bacterium]|nr:30S ribosomal protein S8 [Gemmatimonadota bacterium]
MHTDPIADMLTRIRNAGTAKHKKVDMPVSRPKLEIARLLQENNYIANYKVIGEGVQSQLRVYLKYFAENEPTIRGLQRVSTPGRRVYRGAGGLPRVQNGMGMAIVSTSRGMLTDAQSRQAGVGGEVVALVW